MSKKNTVKKEPSLDCEEKIGLGEKLADKTTSLIGSWRFILIQSVVIFVWIVLNATGVITWDSYPFILLNLFMSFQAAYTAPIIMMSQNRESKRDRQRAEDDYRINRLAEGEVEEIILNLQNIQEKIIHHSQISDEVKEIKAEIKALKAYIKKAN